MDKRVVKVTVWNEFVHEKKSEVVRKIYPQGMHVTIADNLRKMGGFETKTATLDQPEHGLTQAVLDDTDVLVWWGHMAHEQVSDEIAERVRDRVCCGMGLIVLHSAHRSKPFMKLLGTTGGLQWREAREKEILWTVAPSHEIAQGIGPNIQIDEEEMYGEPFGVPEPDKLVFISWFEGGEVFRSGCCWERCNGRIFYFRPGHETHPTYHNEQIMRVIANACTWAAPRIVSDVNACPNPVVTLQPIRKI